MNVHALQDRIEELEDLLGLRVPVPRSDLELTKIERQLLGILYRGGLISSEFAHRAIYGLRSECDQPNLKIIDVFISRLRRKLRPHAIKLSTQWGEGYYFDAENRAKLKSLLNA